MKKGTTVLIIYGLLILTGCCPVITSFNPERGGIGTEVTIEGKRFENVPSKNVVKFGGVLVPTADIPFASPTRIKAKVPVGARTGPISVRNRFTFCTVTSENNFIVVKPLSVRARHNPLYKAESHISTISANAEDSISGINKVTLTITKGKMTDCTELGAMASVIPCRKDAVTFTHVCTYPAALTEVMCQYSENFGDEAIITYKAVAESGVGVATESEEITFAAGYPPSGVLARPIWWHRSDPMGSKIDIGFFPDADYTGIYSDFTPHLETIVSGAFFNIQPFAQTYTENRKLFNLWAAPFGADAEHDLYSISFHSSLTPITGAMDGNVIVHKVQFRDFATLSLGGEGTVFGNAGDAGWIFMHESGHFLYGQGDEYCCDGGYGTAWACKNVFSSQSSCRSYALANSFNPDSCVEIASGTTHTGAWRFDGDLDTLRDRNVYSDWRDGCRKCVLEILNRCATGSCY